VIFLFACVLLNVCFSLLIKWANHRRLDVLGVGCVNYIFAGGTALVWAGLRGGSPLPAGAVGWAIAGGTTYVISYFFIMFVVRHRGISVPMAMANLSLAVPVLFSIFLWHECPTGCQVAGVVLTLPSVVLLSVRSSAMHGKVPGWVIAVGIALFMSAAASRIAQKAFTESYGEPCRAPFTAVWFGTTAVLAVAILLWRRQRPNGSEVFAGVAMGASNIGQLILFLLALRRVPGIIAFPVVSCASLALIALGAVAIWGEQLGRRGKLGIALALVALLLLNVSA